MTESRDVENGGDTPAGVGVLLDFVNTRAIEGNCEEQLVDASSTRQWLSDSVIPFDGSLVTEADVLVARELRSALLAILKEHVGLDERDEAEAATAYLSRAARLYPLAAVISRAGTVLEPIQDGVAGALASVIGAGVQASADPRVWQRVKACKNPKCYKGFYDRTKNTGGAYCSASCASQMSMRAYRSRKAEQAAHSA
ncbi:CGNR zinc finger domain-containing protein [Frondihabitans australicus]|uniref:Putative stress-induced transcription regulator n=1 Tax=Frondihabitans australicus TaxID=386892 RepID=A0A495IIT2_9MICO|nr:CGNR zinc finger domain-containing protein [Frondihabitans australicus]RKR75679.1 putative stress-induced transcription regulator [Frondihabitans australicus]